MSDPRRFVRAIGAILAILAMGGFAPSLAFSSPDERAEDWFPFVISPMVEKSPAFDLREWNEKTAGDRGWLRAEGENFVDESGKVFKIFGTDFTAEGAMPDPDIAAPLAEYLSRNGYNIVRLHFLDNQWGRKTPTLMPESNDVAKDGLNPDGLARLDRFVADLKKAGVRINMNLHVGRQYPGWSNVLPLYSKGTDYFMPDEIAALKEYSRALLTHVNPHTGLAYVDDPAVTVLEITNEDSLTNRPGWLSTDLPEPFAKELQRQWVAWLGERYTTEKLREEWGIDRGPIGPEVTPELPKWGVEKHGGAVSTLSPASEGNGIRWVATERGTENWHLQLSSRRVPIAPGKSYLLQFRARSATENVVNISSARAGGSYNQLGLQEDMALTKDWQSFVFRIAIPAGDLPEGVRLVFSLKNQMGEVEITDFSCREMSGGYLKEDETLEAGNIPFAAVGVPDKIRFDAMHFLSDVEVRFVETIQDFLKKELGCRAMVVNTQVSYGGPLGALRENQASDFVDNHGYWHHPQWLARPWDSRYWKIGNTSQIQSPTGGTLARIALQRLVGKPYSISEYDIPAPSDYSAEMWPMYAAFASFHGWSALYHYTFGHRSTDFAENKITGYFNGGVHPAKAGLAPAAAILFRLGLVAPSRDRVVVKVGKEELIALASRVEGRMSEAGDILWREAADADGALTLRHATALEIQEGDEKASVLGKAPTKISESEVVESDRGESIWDREGGTWILQAPAARAWVGKIGGKTWEAADTSLTVPELSNPAPHATVILVAMDGKAIAESHKLLLTALRRAENQEMQWNEERNSVGREWGTGPVRVLGVHADLTLPEGTKWSVTRLDEQGQRLSPKIEDASSVALRPSDHTMWWLLERN